MATTDAARIISSCISKGSRISGKVDFGEMARIEGAGEGEINGDNIEIGPSAVVMARIAANRVKVSGQVDGEIVARERIEVLPTARLRCTIITPTLVVTEGAQFDGDCKMSGRLTNSRQSESDEAKETSLSFLITQAQRAELRERGYSDDDIKPRHAAALLNAFGLFLLSRPASAWFAEGHEIAAIIASDDLTRTARSHVAQILGVPAEAGSVEKAMTAASIRPDTEFREEDR